MVQPPFPPEIFPISVFFREPPHRQGVRPFSLLHLSEHQFRLYELTHEHTQTNDRPPLADSNVLPSDPIVSNFLSSSSTSFCPFPVQVTLFHHFSEAFHRSFLAAPLCKASRSLARSFPLKFFSRTQVKIATSATRALSPPPLSQPPRHGHLDPVVPRPIKVTLVKVSPLAKDARHLLRSRPFYSRDQFDLRLPSPSNSSALPRSGKGSIFLR